MNTQQSPIHIKSPTVTEYAHPLDIRWSTNLRGTLRSAHGKVQVAFSGDQNERISFDGRSFQIAQFHFHHKSEHWIEGKQFPLELHIVHQNCDPHDGRLAVLGIMIEAGRSKRPVPDLIATMKKAKKDCCHDELEFETDPRKWLPGNQKKYYRYEGSLTTPEYDEIVSWIVFKESLKLPEKEINRLIRYTAEPARLPQPLNRRFVLSNFE